MSLSKILSLLLYLLHVGDSSLRYLVLRARLVLVVEAISEGRGNFLASNGLAASGVSMFVVSDEG